MKLNGWKRIGIMASVVWFLGAYYNLSNGAYRSVLEAAALSSQSCFEHADQQNDHEAWELCQKQSTEYVTKEMTGEWREASEIALIPIPLGWGLAYIMIFVVRWIKRGFV